MNITSTRRVLTRLAVAAAGATAAYGITATGADLAPEPDIEQAGLADIPVDYAPTPGVEVRGISALPAD
jgi:hypothetical protein